MEIVISQLIKQFEDGKVSRRQLIQGLAAAALAASGAVPADASGAAAVAQAAQDAVGGGDAQTFHDRGGRGGGRGAGGDPLPDHLIVGAVGPEPLAAAV